MPQDAIEVSEKEFKRICGDFKRIAWSSLIFEYKYYSPTERSFITVGWMNEKTGKFYIEKRYADKYLTLKT